MIWITFKNQAILSVIMMAQPLPRPQPVEHRSQRAFTAENISLVPDLKTDEKSDLKTGAKSNLKTAENQI